jgi:hypothetical protein
MHNCQNIKEELLNLLFGETSGAQTTQLEHEIRLCADCRNEHREMQNTFSEYEKFRRLDVPEENYWQDYEANLNRKLLALEKAEPKKSFAAKFWHKFLAAQIRIPVPVAAGFAVLFAGALFFAARVPVNTFQTNETVSAEPQIKIVPVETEKIVIREKEIWRDRVVTKTIRVPQFENRIKNPALFAARQKPETKSVEAKIPLLNLAEFEPPPKVEPKIVAEGLRNEK